MVKFWPEHIETAIKKTQKRILHMEKHGLGTAAMEEKHKLDIQKRLLKEIKEK